MKIFFFYYSVSYFLQSLKQLISKRIFTLYFAQSSMRHKHQHMFLLECNTECFFQHYLNFVNLELPTPVSFLMHSLPENTSLDLSFPLLNCHRLRMANLLNVMALDFDQCYHWSYVQILLFVAWLQLHLVLCEITKYSRCIYEYTNPT